MRLLIILGLLPIFLVAQDIREYKYRMSDNDSKVTARQSALNSLKILYCEEQGVTIQISKESEETEDSNYNYSSNYSEKISISANKIVQCKILEEKIYSGYYFLKAELSIIESKYISNDLKYNDIINPKENFIRVVGYGFPNKKMPQEVWFKSAERAAQMDAYRKIVEINNALPIKVKTVTENYIVSEDRIELQMNAIIKNVRPIGKPKYNEDSSVEQVYEYIPSE